MSEAINIDIVGQWFEARRQLALLKAHELVLRDAVFKSAFPNPVEGSSNKLGLGNGYQLTGKHVVNRTVDVALLSTLTGRLSAEGINVDLLFPQKPSLSKTEYNKLTAEQRGLVDNVLTIKNGSSDLSITQPVEE